MSNINTIKRVSPFEKRIHEIDFFRGVLILLVIIDHFLIYFNIYLKNKGISNGFFDWYFGLNNPRSVIQPLALAGFCFVSGVSCVFSKNNLKRSIVCIGIWALLCIGSNVMQVLKNNHIFPDLERVEFAVDLNIIGVLGFCMLIYSLIQKRSWRILVAVIILSFLISTYLIPNLRTNLINLFGSYDVDNTRPGLRYETPNFAIPIFWERLPQADYVPLFPYIIPFFVGSLFSYLFYKKDKKSLIKHKNDWERPICFMGRHTLIIYFLQFVVIVGFFGLLMII